MDSAPQTIYTENPGNTENPEYLWGKPRIPSRKTTANPPSQAAGGIKGRSRVCPKYFCSSLLTWLGSSVHRMMQPFPLNNNVQKSFWTYLPSTLRVFLGIFHWTAWGRYPYARMARIWFLPFSGWVPPPPAGANPEYRKLVYNTPRISVWKHLNLSTQINYCCCFFLCFSKLCTAGVEITGFLSLC